MKDKVEIKTFLKPYHILLISLFLVPFLLKNSSIQLEKRKQQQIEKINHDNFNSKDIIENENLEVNSVRRLDFRSDSLKVCEKGSKDLAKYFETGDTQYVKLYQKKMEEETPEFIKEFIKIISDEPDSSYNVLFIHHISVILFLVFAIASIPGWGVCCACCCCNCCCYSCCKKPVCRLPFFIVVSIMNLSIIITSILALVNVNRIFVGISDTECSILRFINEVLDGESKTKYPRWGGVAAVIEKLNETTTIIKRMHEDPTISQIEQKKNIYNGEKATFENALKNACNNINGESTYSYNTDYILDIAKKFGKYEKNKFTEGSYADKWIKEANLTEDVGKSFTVFGEIISDGVFTGGDSAQELLLNVEDGMEGIKDMIGDVILNFSDEMDYAGRLMFKIIFSILLIWTILIEALLVLLYLFSMQKCIGNFKITVINFIIKILIHIFWNFFALMMVVIFLFGTFLSGVGFLGDDLFQIFFIL